MNENTQATPSAIQEFHESLRNHESAKLAMMTVRTAVARVVANAIPAVPASPLGRAAAAQAAVPAGYALVPLQPTDAMMDAAEACSDDWPRTTWSKAYSAMLAAAPAVPSPPLHGAVGAEPVAWIRKTDITELTDSEPEADGWTPLYATPVATQSGAAAAPVDRNAVLEEAALAAEKIEDDYRDRQSGKWPELRDDAETGAAACAHAIRELKSVSAPDGGNDRKEAK